MTNNLNKYLDLLKEIKGRRIIIENLNICGSKKFHDMNVEFTACK
jgi:hypothetical protein